MNISDMQLWLRQTYGRKDQAQQEINALQKMIDKKEAEIRMLDLNASFLVNKIADELDKRK